MSSSSSDAPEADCSRAIALAVSVLKAQGHDPSQTKLVAAENRLKGYADAAPHRWRLTFKDKHLIPEAAGEIIGAGGDLLVEVDTASGAARIVGYGE